MDILSRKDQVDIKKDNKDVQLLKEELWIRRTTAEVTMLKRNKTIDNLDILEEIKKNNTREHKVDQALKREDELIWKQDGIVYMERWIYIPNNKKLMEWILEENYNPVDVGHLEQQRMIKLAKKNYWWLGLKENIKKYVQGCIKYQQNKV